MIHAIFEPHDRHVIKLLDHMGVVENMTSSDEFPHSDNSDAPVKFRRCLNTYLSFANILPIIRQCIDKVCGLAHRPKRRHKFRVKPRLRGDLASCTVSQKFCRVVDFLAAVFDEIMRVVCLFEVLAMGEDKFDAVDHFVVNLSPKFGGMEMGIIILKAGKIL